MSWLTDLQNASLTDTIAWALLHSTWLGCIVAALGWFSLQLIRNASADARHAVLCGWLLLIPVSAVSLAIISRTPVDTNPATENAAAVSASLDAQQSGTGDAPVSGTVRIAVANSAPTPPNSQEEQPGNAKDKKPTVAEPQSNAMSGWVDGVVSGWLIGVVVLSLRLLLGWSVARRALHRGTSAVSDEIASTASGIVDSLGIRRAVRVLESVGADVPTTIGFMSPVVFLPVSTIANLTPLELQAILAHELAHIRRCDFLVNLAQTVIETLLFFHPAVWWLSVRIRQEREIACDDAAIAVTGNRVSYARALTEVAAQAKQHRLSLAANGSDLSQRVRRIVGLEPVQTRRSVPFWSGSFLLVAAMVIGATLLPTSPEIAAAVGEPSKSAQDAPEDGLDLLKPIAGVVLGNDGKPLAGARVYLRQRPTNSVSEQLDLASRTTDRTGAFRFANVPEPATNAFGRIYPLDVIAVKKGHMIRWQMIRAGRDDIRLQLRKESTFSGQLKDDAGAPIDNARVRVLQIMSLNTISKINLARGNYPHMTGDSYLEVARSPVEISAITDANGRFTLHDLPHRVGIVLEVDDRRVIRHKIYAATTDKKIPSIAVAARARPKGPRSISQIMDERREVVRAPIHNPDDEITLKRGTHVIVKVVDDRTGEPIGGATVTGIKGASNRDNDPVVTDDQGFVHFHQVSASAVHITIEPPSDAGYQTGAYILNLANSDLEQLSTVRLKQGVRVLGVVTDAATGKGIPNVNLIAKSAVSKSFEVVLRSRFDDRRAVVPRSYLHRLETDADGNFEFIASTERTSVSISPCPDGYAPPASVETGETPVMSPLSQVIHPSGKGTVEQLRFLLVPVAPKSATPIEIRYVDESDNPISASVISRTEFSAGAYREQELTTTDDGVLDIAPYVTARRRTPSVLQLLARSRNRRLAVFFRTRDIEGLAKAESITVVLKPVSTVRGRVVDESTGKGIPRAKVRLLMYFTQTGGRGAGVTESDKQGYFEFDRLVPETKYSIGTSATGFVAQNGIEQQLTTVAGQTHEIEVRLHSSQPKTDSWVPDLLPIKLPEWENLSPQNAFELLKKECHEARQGWRIMLGDKNSPYSAEEITRKREPTAFYLPAMMKLAEQNKGSDIEIEVLKWVCGQHTVVGASTNYGPLQRAAASRLLNEYRNRAELADAVSSIVYRLPNSYHAAEQLMASSDHDVQGQARYVAAKMLSQRYRDQYNGNRYNSNKKRLRRESIRLCREIAAEYSDVDHWHFETLGKAAEMLLFQLEHLIKGKIAPEIEGVDLQGQSMKLSDFRGKVVVIHYWSGNLPTSFRAIDQLVEDLPDKPIVVLGVNVDSDVEVAKKASEALNPAYRHWHDASKAIRQHWAPGFPTTHVISPDGTILYLGDRWSGGRFEDAVNRALQEMTNKREDSHAIPLRLRERRSQDVGKTLQGVAALFEGGGCEDDGVDLLFAVEPEDGSGGTPVADGFAWNQISKTGRVFGPRKSPAVAPRTFPPRLFRQVEQVATLFCCQCLNGRRCQNPRSLIGDTIA